MTLKPWLVIAAFVGCACPTPAPSVDGGTGGGSGGGTGAELDAGDVDAGPVDAGTVDAGPPFVFDAGVCAGLPPGAPQTEPWARQRTTVDLPDDFADEYQVHVLYVEPADRTAAVQLDVTGALRRTVSAFNTWLATRTGGPKLRFDTCGGTLDVTYVKLALGENEVATGDATSGPVFIRDRLEAELSKTFHDPKKLYLVYWDGLAYGHCGGAPLPPDLLGHMTGLFVGGIYQATFLTSPAATGATTLSVYSTSEMGFPAAPFDGKLGAETIKVTAVSENSVTLQAGTTQPHSALETLRAATKIPDCRANKFSADGQALAYWEMSAAHECMHPLGIVSAGAPDGAQPPIASGHLGPGSDAGVYDLMYQGTANWGCSRAATNATTSPCKLDPGHRNYFQLPAGSGLADLAKSVFLEPKAPDAVPPAGW